MRYRKILTNLKSILTDLEVEPELIEKATDGTAGVCVVQGGEFKIVSQRLADIFGYPLSDVYKLSLGLFIGSQPDMRTYYRYRIRRKDCEIIWLELYPIRLPFKRNFTKLLIIYEVSGSCTDESESEAEVEVKNSPDCDSSKILKVYLRKIEDQKQKLTVIFKSTNNNIVQSGEGSEEDEDVKDEYLSKKNDDEKECEQKKSNFLEGQDAGYLSEPPKYLEIICPICKAKKLLDINKSKVKLTKGITTISIPSKLICEHHFQAFVDKDLCIRGYQIVDYELAHDLNKDEKGSIDNYLCNQNVLNEFSNKKKTIFV